MTTPRLLLFDIDGTLMTSPGVGRRALDRAFGDLYGWAEATRGIRFGGMTDPLIVRDVFALRGRPPEEAAREQARVIERYVVHLADEVARAGATCRSLPGVVALLDALAPRDDVLLAVLTGNVERGARLKLRATGLWERFRLGAFGDEAPLRPDLLPVALERARRALPRGDFTPRSAVVIGDTPADIGVARAHGARAVAVATGASPKDELEAHAPDALLDDLSDTDAALDALLAA